MKNFALSLILFLCLVAPANSAEVGPPATPVEVTGDQVEYIQGQNTVVGNGHIVVTYQDIRMTCDKATVSMDKKDAIAEGNVVITQGANVFKGDKISYNFEKKTAQIIEAKAATPPWYGAASGIEKTSEDKYTLKKGYVTTCDRDKPHYRLQAKSVKIYLGEKVEARNVLLFIGNIPVLYMPYFTSPILERVPGISVMPGYSKDWGAYALTTMRYYFNEKSKGNIHLDYRERKDFASGIDYKFGTDFMGGGLLRTYYTNQRSLKAKRIWDHEKSATEEKERYRIKYDHKWQIDQNTVVVGEYNKLSDKDVIKDFFYKEYEQQPHPLSYAFMHRADPNWFFSVLGQKRTNDFFTEINKLPEAKLGILNLKLGDTPFYYKSDTSFDNFEKQFTHNAIDDLELKRADSYNQASLPLRLFDFLSFDPYAGLRNTYYSKDILDNRNETRNTFYTGVDLSTKFYKILDTQTNFMGLDINSLRHIVTPSVSYNYIHRPNISPEDLVHLDSIDEIDKRNVFTLELQNKLQTKRQIDNEMKTVDFARFLVSADYMVKYKNSRNKFSDIDSALELRPYRWLYFEATSKYDPNKGVMERMTTDFIFEKNKLKFGLGHRYEREDSCQLTTQVSYKITPGLGLRAYHRYEFDDKKLQEQEYAITRDLHCWTVEVVYNKRDAQCIWVVFKLKAFPDMPIKFSTTYSEPKSGSPGEY